MFTMVNMGNQGLGLHLAPSWLLPLVWGGATCFLDCSFGFWSLAPVTSTVNPACEKLSKSLCELTVKKKKRHFWKQSVSLGRQDLQLLWMTWLAPYIPQAVNLAPLHLLSWDEAMPTLRNWNLVLSNACLECLLFKDYSWWRAGGGVMPPGSLNINSQCVPLGYEMPLWAMRYPFCLAFSPRQSRSVDLIWKLEHWGNGTKDNKNMASGS